ncbi:MAG: GTP cyclohydrolase I FolE [Planctomycetota bacterium]
MIASHSALLGTNGHSCVDHACDCLDHESSAQSVAHRGTGRVDQARLARAVREMLIAVGEDPDRDGLLDTPKRVAKAYAELFRGLSEDAGTHLARTFEQASGELITVTNINFFSLCEHHLLPFHGQAHVAYLPRHGRVVGLSKLARTVEVFARRPQLQERLTDQIADALVEHLDVAGAVVMVEGEHMCMRMRGVRSHDANMTTFARRGIYRDEEQRGMQAMQLVRDLAHRAR